jgi:hypothetical protein
LGIEGSSGGTHFCDIGYNPFVFISLVGSGTIVDSLEMWMIGGNEMDMEG